MSAVSTLPAPDLDRVSDPDVAVAWSKVCTVCKKTLSRAEWDALPYVGRMDDGEGGDLELRNHFCFGPDGNAATLSITVCKEAF